MSRTTFEHIDDLEAASRTLFLNGLIEGSPIARTVSAILQLSAAYGADLADQKKPIHAAVSYTSFDDLKRDAVELMVETLCNGGVGSVRRSINQICLRGAAFGHQTVVS